MKWLPNRTYSVMEHLTAAEAVVKYQPLIIHECQNVWRSAMYCTPLLPCELADLIQSARLRVMEKWASCTPNRTAAPWIREAAHNAAIDCLRQWFMPPVDLTLFAEYAA